jgi:hypothetical protein
VRPEEDARRYAFAFPGFELIGYGEIALPFYAVSVEAVVQIRRPIPAIEEFVLQAVSIGLTDPTEIGEFLGLDARVLERAILAQWNEAENIDYPGIDGSGRHELVLTHKGETALRDLASIVPERREFVVAFDRVLWGASTVRSGDLLPRKLVPGARELRPKKQVRPKPTDFTVPEVNSIVLDVMTQFTGSRGEMVKEVVAITGLGQRRERVLPAVLLGYETEDGADFEAKVVVDGRLSPLHSAALGESGNFTRDDLVASSHRRRASQHASVARVPEHLRSQIRPRGDTAAAHSRVAAIRAALVGMSQADDDEPARKGGDAGPDLADQLAGALATLYAPGVRIVPPWEHRLLLDEAVSSARRRLTIVTQSLRESVVDANLVDMIRRVADGGAQVTIAYSAEEEDRAAVRLLGNAAEQSHGRIRVDAVQPPVEATLIWDDRWAVSTFDWLGYRARSETLRADEGLLVTLPVEVDEAQRAALAWLAGPSG